MADPSARRLPRVPRLGPVAVATIGIIGTVLLWRSLTARDRSYAGQQIQAEAETSARQVAVELEMLLRALERLGERWVSRAGMNESEWLVDAEALLRDFPGYERVGWADSTRRLRWLLPVSGQPPPLEPRLGSVSAIRRFLDGIETDRRSGVTWSPASVFSEPGVLAAVPLCYLEQCDGFMIGLFQPQPLLDGLLSSLPPGYVVVIRDAGRLLAVAPGGASTSLMEWSRSAPLRVGAVSWIVTVRPTTTTLATLLSLVPNVALASGLSLSILLGLALRLAAVSEGNRRRAEWEREDAERSERRFHAMFDSAFQFVALLDLDGNVLEANRTALSLARVDREEVRGRPLWEGPWWNGDTGAATRWVEACHEAARGGLVRWEETLHTGEETSAYDLSLKPIQSPEGTVSQLLAEGRDVSERKRAEAALQEIDTLGAMGRLAARVAHEINNPLAGIRNAFLLLRDAVPSTHPHYGFVGAIEREITRIADVTRQLYETYRPDQEHRPECAVGTVVSDVVSLLRQVNRDSSVQLVVEVQEAPQVLRVPEGVVRQTVYNLVQNAVEASPDGGIVTVRAGLEHDDFLLTVTDQGPGVPPELRERIFEPFFSTKAGLTTGGMGLGLALVARSVRAVGGTVDVEEGPDGRGARFVIRLPRSSERIAETA